jgi:hypothetical protein
VSSKLSGNAQQKLDIILEGRRKVDRLHGLIEQYAAGGQDLYAGMISRAAVELGRVLLNAGYGVMADYANSMAQQAKRGGATQGKFRALRDGLALLRPALDRAEKQVYEEEKTAGAAGAD